MNAAAATSPTCTRVPTRGGGELRAYLLLVSGQTSSIVSLPRNGELVIGRGADADVRLADDAASRRHLRLSVVEGEIEATDLDSHNGTRINGQALAGVRRLGSGDVVAIGETTLVLHARPPTEPRAVADAAGLRARLAAEVERALRGERAVSVIALALGAAPPRAAVVDAIEPILRSFDLVGWLDDHHLVVVAPELDSGAAAQLAARCATAAAALAPSARAGLADCPADGCDADSLLAAARAATLGAAPGSVGRATRTDHVVELGDRSIVIADPGMVRLFELVRRLAASTLSVVITGETGAGKENAAFAIHHYSARRDQRFVTLNCAALPDGLIESELFGHERGAFTGAIATKPGLFEIARGGTVFLDEIGELPLAAQAKLLRAVEARRATRLGGVADYELDVRLVAATHRDLDAEVAAGRFRQDLRFRLGQAIVTLPPLRDRPRELILLARRFLDAACRAAGRPPLHLASATLHHLTRYSWPGNVRELKNVMELAAATIVEDTFAPEHLPERLTGAAPAAAPSTTAATPIEPGFTPLHDELRDLERRRMSEALRATRGNRTRAAELLQMPLRTFLSRIKVHALTEIGRPA